jgi:hypothetical protein
VDGPRKISEKNWLKKWDMPEDVPVAALDETFDAAVVDAVELPSTASAVLDEAGALKTEASRAAPPELKM